MGHRVALYHVQVRPHRDTTDWRLLGDYDQAGRWLGEVLRSSLLPFDRTNRDGSVTARFEAELPELGDDQVGASFLSGRSGMVSVISKPGGTPFDRTPDHFEEMRTAVLFDLPRGKDSGRLAVHIPEGRSIKGLIDRALTERLSQDQFSLKLNPVVPASALRSAVDRNAVESVKLIKRAPARSERFADAAQWGDEEVDRLQLTVASKRNRKLKNEPLKKFLEDPSDANRKNLYEFHGLLFDEVGVEVDMPDGSRRTFFVEPRPGGHPMTADLNADETDRYGATRGVLSRELREAVTLVAPNA